MRSLLAAPMAVRYRAEGRIGEERGAEGGRAKLSAYPEQQAMEVEICGEL